MNISSLNQIIYNYQNKTFYNGKINNLKQTNQIAFHGPLSKDIFLKNESKQIRKDENPSDIFFTNMQNYGKNYEWANKMLKLSIDIASDIEQKKSFKEIIERLQQGISSIYQNDSFGRYKHFPSEFYIIEDEPKRGIEYLKRYLKKIDSTRTNCYSPESNSEYKNANTCRIVKYKKDNDTNAIIIEYGIFRDRLTNKPIGNMSSNLELAEKEYNKLLQIPKPSLKQINKSCAIIHWLIAQESPWQRGSDSIARLLTASIYSAYGIKIFPPKKGISFDFEAFYTNLNDYIKKYPYLFTKKPMKSKE